MSRNASFNNFNNPNEQALIENLIIESIGIYGHDVFYCPRTLNKKDDIYGEDQLSSYDTALDTVLYIKSMDSYGGDGTFLSKFNLEVRDQIIFTIARRTFQSDIANMNTEVRPLEGDLIYSTMMKRLFIIKYVENTPIFYQMGSLQTWDLTCEVFEYSNERFNTGIGDIDNIQTIYSFSGSGNTILSNTAFGDSLLNGIFENNIDITTEGSGLIDFTDIDPFSEGNMSVPSTSLLSPITGQLMLSPITNQPMLKP